MPVCSYVCVAHMMAEEPCSLCRRGAVRTVVSLRSMMFKEPQAVKLGVPEPLRRVIMLSHYGTHGRNRHVVCRAVWSSPGCAAPCASLRCGMLLTAAPPPIARSARTQARGRTLAQARAHTRVPLPCRGGCYRGPHGQVTVAPLPPRSAALASCTVVNAGYARSRWDCAT